MKHTTRVIALILIQPSKSGGMGAAFGGIGESVFGGKAGSHLTKTTVILTAIFFVGHEMLGKSKAVEPPDRDKADLFAIFNNVKEIKLGALKYRARFFAIAALLGHKISFKLVVDGVKFLFFYL